MWGSRKLNILPYASDFKRSFYKTLVTNLLSLVNSRRQISETLMILLLTYSEFLGTHSKIAYGEGHEAHEGGTGKISQESYLCWISTDD